MASQKKAKPMRLDKFLSHSTARPRSHCRAIIKAERVQVNNIVVKNSGHILQADDVVLFDDQPLNLAGPTYIMLHKPKGYVCANEDSEHPTVFDLISDDLNNIPRKNLSVAGRLDIDTTGMVLISDDGQWVHHIISPNKHCEKCYFVTLKNPVSADDITAFKDGIILNNEDKPTKPAQLKAGENNTAEVTLSEGRYHQVKRMFAARDNRVLELHRQQIGPLTLNDSLGVGEFRHLQPEEVSLFSAPSGTTAS